MSSLVTLPSSSFFLSEYLTDKIVIGNFTERQFNYALNAKNIAALNLAVKQLEPSGNQWLNLHRTLATTQGTSAITLGKYYLKLAKGKHNSPEINTAVMWFNQAIRLGFELGNLELAKLYFEQGNISLAEQHLTKFSSVRSNTQSMVLAIKIAIYHGELKEIKRGVATLRNSNQSQSSGISADSENQKQLLLDIHHFNILTNMQSDTLEKQVGTTKATKINNDSSNNEFSLCTSSLQLFATNLSHLKHLEKLINEFTKHQPLSDFICLPAPRYISKKQLSCDSFVEQAISCDESLWQKVADSIETRHVGLMLEKGGANVHFGILYFDKNDDVNVFSHEVSHLLGFVDEYPLVETHLKCQKVQTQPFSHNIVTLKNYYQGRMSEVRQHVLTSVPWAKLIDETTPILTSVKLDGIEGSFWKVETPESYAGRVGLFRAETCDQARASHQETKKQVLKGFNAFKPVHEVSQLRYFSHKFPAQYITQLKSAPSDFLMPSFHYNIGLALYHKGKAKQAAPWFHQAAGWELSKPKSSMIMQGQF